MVFFIPYFLILYLYHIHIYSYPHENNIKKDNLKLQQILFCPI